mgnify:CR=1 FL=1
MIKFIVGKIPGEVVEIEFAGDSLTILEAVKLGAAKVGFPYEITDVVYLNGDVSSFDTVIGNNDVVLIDIPKIKGNQKVIRIGREGQAVKSVAIHNNYSVNDALIAAEMEKLSEGEEVYIDGERVISSTILEDGEIIVIKRVTRSMRDTGNSAYCINIYEAIANLEERISVLER